MHDGCLLGMGAGTDDVIDLASFQKARNGFVRETVISVKQPNHLAAQPAQHGIDERQGVAAVWELPAPSQKLATILAWATKAGKG